LALPRTSPDCVLFTTYNLLNLFQEDSPPERERYQLVADTIRALGTDVLAVQEIRAPDEPAARQRLRQLAGDTGLRCTVPCPDGEDQPALAIGPHGYHCGLLWRDGIDPVPGSLRCHGAGYFWHSLASVTLDVGGTRVRHASHHAAPFGRRLRADQNEMLVALVTGAPRGIPAMVGADWNTECADRVRDEASGEWILYEPGDPYAAVEWFDEMIGQCEWEYDERGQRRHRADRTPGDVLWSGGLLDAAAVLNAPWQPTAGHHPDDAFGARGVWRRIDGIRVTRRAAGALRAHHVEDTEAARRASDHLPATAEYAPAALGAGAPAP
jgi:endonuclease/exonuclease/phosphatase family metal-dependent hydrolase